MKKKSIMTMAVILIAAGLAAMGSCQKDPSKARVQNISNNGCKPEMTDNKGGENDAREWVELSYDSGVLRVCHHNLTVNCAFKVGGIDVDIQVDGDTITINEYEHDGPIADCICHTDNVFEIANLPHGIYTLVFNSWDTPPYTCTYGF
jgi:hypothetical protein